MEVGERLAVSQQHKNEDVVGNETVEEKRGAAVNVVVHVDDGDKGDDRQEVIGSDNTGGGGAKTDGIAAREQKEAMDSAARMAAKTAYLKVEITSSHKLQTYPETIF